MCQRILIDSTPPVQEKTGVDTRDKRERDYKRLQRAQVALPVWLVSRVVIREKPGTHCSLIEQEEREDSSCQI